MGLTDTFVKQVKPVKKAGDKYADSGGMYLLVRRSELRVVEGGNHDLGREKASEIAPFILDHLKTAA